MAFPDPSGRRGGGNAAFRVGSIAGILMVVVLLVLMLITSGDRGTADFIGWVFSWPAIYLAASTAASQQYAQQEHGRMNPTDGVVGAAVGTGLITVFFVWAFILARDVIMDVPSFSTTIGILRLPLDVIIALGLGAMAGNRVANRHGGSGGGDFYS